MAGVPINRLRSFMVTFMSRSYGMFVLPVQGNMSNWIGPIYVKRSNQIIRSIHLCSSQQQRTEEIEENHGINLDQTANILFENGKRSRVHKNVRSFGLMFDIDGVLVRGRRVIPTASIAMKKVLQLNIPMIFLTNGGCETEEHKAKVLSTQLHHKVIRMPQWHLSLVLHRGCGMKLIS